MTRRLRQFGALLAVAGVALPVVVSGAMTGAEGEAVPMATVLVTFRDGADATVQDEVLARVGGVVSKSIAPLDLHVVEVPEAALADALSAYVAEPSVESAVVERTRELGIAATDPAYGSQWALPRIGWEAVHREATVQRLTRIAVLDTGVDDSVADLADRVIGGYSAIGGVPTSDPNGHGTMVASIAAAAADNDSGIAGVAATAAVVMPVQVLDADGLGTDGDIIDGLVWAAENGADVVLMAFSNPGASAPLQAAIDYAWALGTVVVAATGNEGSTSPTYPAGLAKVVGVAATDQGDLVWSSSNNGAATFIGAPGVDISAISPDGEVRSATGTSAAAAVVAGALAVLKAVDPAASNGTLIGRLARNTDPLAAGAAGNGRLNLARAVADTSTDSVIPAGAAGGGPIVGPYLAAGSGTISGTISSSAGGTVAGATVTCTSGCGSPAPTTTTASNGTYSLSATWGGSGAGSATVRVTAPGFTLSSASVTVTNSTTVATTYSPTLTFDAGAPTVTSISRVSNEFVKAGATATWEITFSETVSAVAATAFTLVQESGSCASGGGTPVPTLGTPTAQPSGTSSNKWRISSGIGASGDCVLRLDMKAVPPTNIVDADAKVAYGPVTGQTITVDRTAPTAAITTATNNTSTVSWTVTFSEAVSNVDSTDFALATTGLTGTPAISSVTPTGGSQPATTFTVTASTGSGSGTIGLNLIAGNDIVDRAANGVAAVTGATFTIDRTPPSVSSVTRVGTSPTNTNTVSWTVTFSKSVTGVDATDFVATVTTGDLVVGTPSVSGSGSSYTVSVTRSSGQGTVRLDVLDDDTIVDGTSLALSGAFNTGDTITIDTAVPTVSIARVSNEFVTGGTVTWEVTFSEVVVAATVNAGDFAMTTVSGACDSGGSAAAVGAPTQQTDLTKWRISSGTGGTNQNCVLRLDLAASPTISDAAGNAVAAGTTGQTITVDRTAPTTASIVRNSSSPTAASSVAWTVTFSEPVTGVAAADFTLTLTGVTGASITNVAVAASGSEPATTFIVTASTGTGSGTLALGIAAARTINDRAGNAMSSSAVTSAPETYTIDRAAPMVTSINRAATSPTNAATVSWTVVFSKAVDGVDSSDFALAATGVSGASISSVSPSGGSQPATTFTVTASTGSGSGSLGLNLVDDNSIMDDADQALVGASADDGSFTGQVYALDRTAPTVGTFIRLDSSPTNGASVRWTVTFSESVTGVDAADFSTTTTGTLVIGTLTVSGSGSSYTVTAPITSGEGTVQVNVVDNDTIQDVVGYALGGTGTSGAGNGSALGTDAVYTIDRVAPTTQSITRYLPANNPATQSTVQWLVTFSEAVTMPADPAVAAANFTLYKNLGCTGSPTRIRNFSISSITATPSGSSSTQWLVSVDTGVKNGDLCLDQKRPNRSALIADPAGNAIATDYLMSDGTRPADRYVVAKDAPFVTGVTRVAGAVEYTQPSSASWLVTFSEAVGGDPTLNTADQGVTVEDFCLTWLPAAVDCAAGTPAVITSVVAVPGSAVTVTDSVTNVSRTLYSQYTVTASLAGLGEGQVRLDLVDNNTIYNRFENELRSSISTSITSNLDGTYRLGQTYTIDTTAPTLTSSVIGDFSLDKTYTAYTVRGSKGAAAGDGSGDVTFDVFPGATIDVDESAVVESVDRSGGPSATTWSRTVPGSLPDGWYTLRAAQTDLAGNTATVTRVFLIDNVAPVVAFDGALPETLTNDDGSQTWAFTVAEGVGTAEQSGLHDVDCSLNGVDVPCALPSAGPSAASATVSIDKTLNEGCNALVINLYDEAGNLSTIEWHGVLDTGLPGVEILSPVTDDATNDVTPAVTGVGGTEEPTACSGAYAGGSTYPADMGAPSTDNETVLVSLYAGQMTAGDLSVASAIFESPYEAVRDPDTGEFVLEIVPTAIGAVIAAGLPEGWYSLLAEQSDEAGNLGTSDIVWFLVDTTAPTADFVKMPDLETNQQTAPFEFLRDDPWGSNVNAEPSDFETESPYVQCNLDDLGWVGCPDVVTFFEASISGASEGYHTLEVMVEDRAGNESDIEPYTWLVDYTEPTVEITSAPADPTVITGATTLLPSVFGFTSDDPDLDYVSAEEDGPAVPSEVEDMLCKLDSGSFVDCATFTSHSYPALGIGRHTFTVRAVDGAGNFTDDVHVWDIQANRTILYTGVYLVSKPGSIALSAAITSGATACRSGVTVNFSLSLDGVTGWSSTATSNSSGVATLTVLSTGTGWNGGATAWTSGVYDVTVEVAETEACTGAIDYAAVTVADSGSAATGGGAYTVAGIGRVNFGLSINRVPFSNPAQFKGQVVAQNNGKWRLKGSINNYVKMLTTTGVRGSASGIGTLQWWDSSIGDSGAWVVVARNVAFSILFEDTGAKKGADSFTVNNIAYQPSGLTFGQKMFTTSTTQGLKGGDVRIS
ncbi:MAG: S8 family serine peptidase [Ilumatobacteraceae bacterium]